MTTGEFLKFKKTNCRSKIPEYRLFEMKDTTRDIIWKIIMSKRNTIVCVNRKTRKVEATIGLIELFSLYVQ